MQQLKAQQKKLWQEQQRREFNVREELVKGVKEDGCLWLVRCLKQWPDEEKCDACLEMQHQDPQMPAHLGI
eukprot:1160396-Pelagomonas_calceolata.AAC.24